MTCEFGNTNMPCRTSVALDPVSEKNKAKMFQYSLYEVESCLLKRDRNQQKKLNRQHSAPSSF